MAKVSNTAQDQGQSLPLPRGWVLLFAVLASWGLFAIIVAAGQALVGLLT